MTLPDLLSADAPVLLAADGMGESIVYRPAGGGAYTIPALVTRGRPDSAVESSRSRTRIYRVTVLRSTDPTRGVAQPAEGVDHVEVPIERGGELRQMRVHKLRGSTPAIWSFEVVA